VNQLGELAHLLAGSPGAPTQILAVSIDTHAQSRQLVRELAEETVIAVPRGGSRAEREPGPRIDFPLLEDRDHAVIDRYGILNPQGRGWPHPATYVIDREGVVRWRFVEVDYRIRPSNAMILEALRGLR
jgi:alkyl hydroperoxide reductase subunit AhpC